MQPRPLRIALISEHASPLACLGSVDAGGQNVYVNAVARCLAEQGHQVDVLTRRDAPAQRAAVDVRPGMRVLHVPAGPAQHVAKEHLLPHMPAFMHCAQQLFSNSVPYDVIHANFFMSGLVGLRLREAFGVPLVTTFHALGLVRREHQGEADAFPSVRVDIERRLVRESDRLVAECPQDRNDLMRLYGARGHRIDTVPCGVDTREFAPMDRAAARAQLGLPQHEFIVLQVGRMVPRKGVDTVIRALGLLDAHVPARLVVVGGEADQGDPHNTPEIGRLAGVADECGVGSRVTFVGHRQRAQLRAYYAAADVFVSTPWYEPFGITPLEAMACGTPVVGSAVGGIQYSVVDGVTGWLVPPREPQALAQALQQLHANPALGRAMGRAGVRRVRSLFTWDHVASCLSEVYRSVLRTDLQPSITRPQAAEQGHGAAASTRADGLSHAGMRLVHSAPTLRQADGPSRRAAVFLDKDGTLVHDVPYNVDPARLRFTPGAMAALRLLAGCGWALVVVTNQPGLAQGRFTSAQLERLRRALEQRVQDEAGVELTGFYFCPHAPASDGSPQCACRKPAPGLLQQAARAHRLDLSRSWMVGDILDDVEAGRRAGCRSVLLDVGHETQWRSGAHRTAHHRCADLWEVAQLITGRAMAGSGVRTRALATVSQS